MEMQKLMMEVAWIPESLDNVEPCQHSSDIMCYKTIQKYVIKPFRNMTFTIISHKDFT